MRLSQSNNGGVGLLQLEQSGSQFKGTAGYSYSYEAQTGLPGLTRRDYRAATGPVVGTINGSTFEATIYWSNQSVGVYTGQIGPQGLLVGRTYDKTDPAATADFHSEQPLVCLSRSQSAPGLSALPAKPPVALGRVQTQAPVPTQTSICDAAKSARARNSPAAPSLERQCNALTATMNFSPRVLAPAPGSTHRPQTAMAIRVAAGQQAKDTAYELEIQVQANVDWHVLTYIPVPAAVAQAPGGYRGWGGHADGTGAQMTATAGVYRVRAKATAPSPSAPSDWVEFKIDGVPGVTVQDAARSTVEKAGTAAATMKPATSARVMEAPRINSRNASAPPGTAATPRPTSALATDRSPLDAATSKTDAMLLKPQPLPPSAPPTQAPSALR